MRNKKNTRFLWETSQALIFSEKRLISANLMFSGTRLIPACLIFFSKCRARGSTLEASVMALKTTIHERSCLGARGSTYALACSPPCSRNLSISCSMREARPIGRGNKRVVSMGSTLERNRVLLPEKFILASVECGVIKWKWSTATTVPYHLVHCSTDQWTIAYRKQLHDVQCLKSLQGVFQKFPDFFRKKATNNYFCKIYLLASK